MSHASDPLFVAIHDLVTRILDGEATATDRACLAELVGGSAEARRLYVRYMQETAVLRWQHAGSTTDCSRIPETAADGRRVDGERLSASTTASIGRWLAGLALTSAVSIVVLAGMRSWRQDDRGVAPVAATAGAARPPAALATRSTAADPATKVGVATLTRTSRVIWSDPTARHDDLTRLGAGDVLRFDRGELEVVFDSGVGVLIRGPAEFEVRGVDFADARLGTISARVGKDGRGFTIQTPTARIVDLGTEFGIEVAPSGATEVAVFRGLVNLSVHRDDPPRRLRQGEALRVAADGSLDRVVAIAGDRFPEQVVRPPQEPPAAPLITSVRDDNGDMGSRKFYRIVHAGLREDAQAYVDRNHQWNGVTSDGIPAFLRGLDYIMPYNDDKFADRLHVSVEVARPSILYVLYSDSLVVPDWLRRDFIDTGHDIGLDEAKNRYIPSRRTDVGPGASVDTVFSVWKREVPVPATVTLGAVEGPSVREGYNMYGIAAGPLPSGEESVRVDDRR